MPSLEKVKAVVPLHALTHNMVWSWQLISQSLPPGLQAGAPCSQVMHCCVRPSAAANGVPASPAWSRLSPGSRPRHGYHHPLTGNPIYCQPLSEHMNEIACVEWRFIVYRIQNLLIALRQREKLSMANLRTIYFNEYNVLMGDATYLPLVSGLLHAAALTSEKVKEHYTIAPYIFHLDAPANIFSQYKTKPDVAAFSVMMWNEQLNLHVAREIKKRYPDVVIIFGGAQVPHHPEAYFREHPFIDVAVRGEGEDAFREILERLADGEDLENLIGVTWRTRDGEIRGDADERPFERNLDLYPSPYLEGLYNDLMKSRPDLIFQAIIETNRGCPFHCTFCYWGKGGLSRKYRYHGLDRIFAEIDWLGQNQIRYVFNADSNFGMHRRDSEIAEFLVATKKKYSFPEKFRTCYGKNTDEKIFFISNILHQYNMEKGITISYQRYPIRKSRRISSATILSFQLHESFIAGSTRTTFQCIRS